MIEAFPNEPEILVEDMKPGDVIRFKLTHEPWDEEDPWQLKTFVVNGTVDHAVHMDGGYLGLREGDTYKLVSRKEQPQGDTPTGHYTGGNIECVDYLHDNMPFEAFIGFIEGNVKKYLHRWRYKGKPVEDLRKARDYLTVLINVMEGKEPKFKEWKK